MNSAETEALVQIEHERVLSLLSNLPGRQREVLVLRYYGQLSEAEIATTLGISRGSVKSHNFRGLRSLRGSDRGEPMTAERLDDDQVGQRLAEVLETEANAVEVGDAWDAIAGRLLDPDWSGARLGPVSATRSRAGCWVDWLQALVSRQRLWWQWCSAGARQL